MKDSITYRSVEVLQLLGAALLLSACGAGQYSFSRYYVPLEEEESYHDQSREYTYTEISTKPENYKGRMIAWFGPIWLASADDAYGEW